ncbi:uncharacterized protein LOC134748209 [Cydia strobilella]|uniref:uncharacterized protein LOC134748209 n=1 Tax=Cydia strobilella TaxID=1100964 RepID=UPI003005F37C
MSIERARACVGPSPVTKRLCATIVFFIGVICVFGGYLFCHMSRNDVKRSNEIVSFNLTIAAENLYKKAKRIPPKAILHNDPEKVTARLLDIFNCSQADCGTISHYNVAEFMKRSINLKVIRLLKSVNNATMYLDSLR